MYAKNKRKIHPEFELFLKLSASDNSSKIRALEKALKQAIESELTQKQGRVMDMYYFENMSMTKIAEVLGVNKSTISRHIKSATERLRKALKYAEFALRSSGDE